jgi:ERCC4-type nuclease
MPEIVPTVLIDTREQIPLEIEGYPTERTGLPVGDYGLRGFSTWENPAFIVERKSLPDLIGSLTQGRKRFLAEIEKMRGFRFRAVLVEGRRDEIEAGDYRSKATPASLLASIDALTVRAGIHFLWANDPRGAAVHLESLIRQFIRGIEKDFKRLQESAKPAAKI